MDVDRSCDDPVTTMQKTRRVDMKLEVVVLPVSDVDRAKRFYQNLDWRLDADFTRKDGSRAAQFTPPGSQASIHLGEKPLYFLVVSDIDAARADLAKRGVEVSGVFHRGRDGVASGPDPELPSYGSLATFSDPDGNAWLLQEVTARLPGRVDPDVASFASAAEIAAALRRVAAAHGEHEAREGGQRDENWPDCTLRLVTTAISTLRFQSACGVDPRMSPLRQTPSRGPPAEAQAIRLLNQGVLLRRRWRGNCSVWRM